MPRHAPARTVLLIALLAAVFAAALPSSARPIAAAAPTVAGAPTPATTPAPPAQPTETHGGVPYDPRRDRGCAGCGPNGRPESGKDRVFRWADDCGESAQPAGRTREGAVVDSVERLYSESICADTAWADSGFTGTPPGWIASRHNAPALFASQTRVGGGGAVAPGPGGGNGFGLPRIDPKAWVVEAVIGVVQEVSDPLAVAVKGALYKLLFTGGELTYDHPTVKELWAVSRRLANLLLAVLALWSLADLALGQARGRTYHEALEFVGRVFLGFVFANLSAVGLAWLVRLADLVTAVFAGADTLTRLGPPTAVDRTLLAALVWLIFWLVGALFFGQVLLRIALIDVCLILAPVALVCWTQPRLQRVVRVWWTILAGLLAGQIVQVVALRLALSLAAAPALGANPIINGLVLIALSFLAVRASVQSAAAGVGALVGSIGGRGGGGTGGGAAVARHGHGRARRCSRASRIDAGAWHAGQSTAVHGLCVEWLQPGDDEHLRHRAARRRTEPGAASPAPPARHAAGGAGPDQPTGAVPRRGRHRLSVTPSAAVPLVARSRRCAPCSSP